MTMWQTYGVSYPKGVLKVEAESAGPLRYEAPGNADNCISLRKVQITKAFFLTGHGDRAKCVYPNSEGVGIKSWLKNVGWR